MEFYTSEHVFEGKVISKTYAQDSLQFTVRLEVVKHFKDGANPKYMDFTFRSEGKYTGITTSCDWFINKDENWLIFTHYINNKLSFNSMCSNSQFLKDGISKQMRAVLANANSFSIQDYIFNRFEGKFISDHHVKLDSLVKKLRKKLPEEPETIQLVMIINEQGRLEKVNAYFMPPYHIYKDMEYDSIYRLIKDYHPHKRDSIKEIELHLMESISLIKNWNILIYEETNEPIKYYLNPGIKYDSDINEWKYLEN
jgi:hypothetical protein